MRRKRNMVDIRESQWPKSFRNHQQLDPYQITGRIREDEQPLITTTISTSGDEPIIPRLVPPDRLARWKVKHQCLLIRTVPKEPPRSKAAAFDLDGTLLVLAHCLDGPVGTNIMNSGTHPSFPSCNNDMMMATSWSSSVIKGPFVLLSRGRRLPLSSPYRMACITGTTTDPCRYEY
jgi:hypothetical protein